MLEPQLVGQATGSSHVFSFCRYNLDTIIFCIRERTEQKPNTEDMTVTNIKKIVGVVAAGLLGCAVVTSCAHKTPTPDNTKFLPAYHAQYNQGAEPLYRDSLALYVDYSTCMVLGQSSPLYNALLPSFVDAARKYYSIKGPSITQEHGPAFELLRTIKEVNYADLKTAVERMAEGQGESALLTDGEFYQQSIAKGNINNPYLAKAFKKWLLRGHDIFIISEPYIENSRGKLYHKKRFYILFTDVRLAGNIYDRIMQTARLQDFPEAGLFHISADHPSLMSLNGAHSAVNPLLNAKVQGYGNYEIQDWELGWEDAIEPLLISAVDSTTGNPLPNGEYITKGIKVDRNSLGAFRIESVTAKAYDINEPYMSFCDAKNNGMKPRKEENAAEITNFVKLDDKDFKRHGEITLYFDTQMFDPSWMNGQPYNYMKVAFYVSSISPIFSQFADMFKFESIDIPGQTNVSVAASIEQCMADPDVQQKVMQSPIYTIYVKSFER